MENIVRKTTNDLPAYSHKGDAAVDLKADLWSLKIDYLFNTSIVYTDHEDGPKTIHALEIHPGGRALIPTGIHASAGEGYYFQICPRSGLGIKNGVFPILGVVDSGYTGDIGITLINAGLKTFTVHQGDRIAQMIRLKTEPIEWNEVDSLDNSDRGEGGFGSTGI